MRVDDYSYLTENKKNYIRIEPADFLTFTKLIELLSKENNDTISIKNNEIIQGDNKNIIIYTKLDNIFNNTIKNLDIISPNTKYKIFNQFDKTKPVILEEKENYFILTNNEIELTITKLNKEENFSNKLPDLDKLEFIEEYTMNKETRKKIKTLIKNESDDSKVNYLFQKNEDGQLKLKKIFIPNNIIYTLHEYIKENNNLTDTNNDLNLLSGRFLPIENSEKYKLTFYKTSNKSYILVCKCVIDKLEITTYEICDESTGENFII